MIEMRVAAVAPPATEPGVEETAAGTNAEEPTFEALYRTHAKRIYSLAYRFTGNAADAEELLQDIFLQAYRKLDSFRQEAALSTWLHRLAVNRCLDHLRSRVARQDARTGSLADEARPQPRAAYASAIRDLEQLAGARAPVLPAVQTVLAGNLAVVERAIAESRSAVEAAPGSEVARDRLRAGLANKLALLRTSAALGLERIERR